MAIQVCCWWDTRPYVSPLPAVCVCALSNGTCLRAFPFFSALYRSTIGVVVVVVAKYSRPWRVQIGLLSTVFYRKSCIRWCERASERARASLFLSRCNRGEATEGGIGNIFFFLLILVVALFFWFLRGAWFTFDRLWTHHSSCRVHITLATCWLPIALCSLSLSLCLRSPLFFTRFSLAFLSVHPPPSVRADRWKRKRRNPPSQYGQQQHVWKKRGKISANFFLQSVCAVLVKLLFYSFSDAPGSSHHTYRD